LWFGKFGNFSKIYAIFFFQIYTIKTKNFNFFFPEFFFAKNKFTDPQWLKSRWKKPKSSKKRWNSGSMQQIKSLIFYLFFKW
jgi:hypothetical protein